MASTINLSRLSIVSIATGINGTGPITTYFVKDAVAKGQGEPANFLFGLRNVSGVFSALTINVEFSPTIDAAAYWEVVASWQPLTQPILTCPSAESGFFRLNVTTFTGGTSFEVWGTCGNGAASGSGSGGGSVTQGTSPWIVAGGGTAGTPGTAVLTIQGVGSGTAITVSSASAGSTGSTAPTSAVEEGLIGTSTALPTAVTAGQLVGGMGDLYGRQIGLLNAPRGLVATASLHSASGSAVTFITNSATGVFADIISLIITNETSTATIVTLSDDGSSGNTYLFAIAANGGIVINFPTPLPQGTSAVNWDVLNSAAVALDYIAVYHKTKAS